jgi:hypothetical protein
MNRSPLFYPMSRGMDGEAGGAADLQTDVMRFMAIISMCLVAIFALVQSIPVTTTTPDDVVTDTVEPAPTRTVQTSEPDIELTRPAPPRYERPKETMVVLERPAPKPVERRNNVPRNEDSIEVSNEAIARTVEPVPDISPPADTASPATESSAETQKGFTLRFESDHALTRLVEQDIVGLYAIGDDGTHRMSIESDQPSFWSASPPARFHEMDSRTVPRPVLMAYERRNAGSPDAVKWGVSLPAAMSRQLNTFLNGSDGGALVIGQDGGLRLEN